MAAKHNLDVQVSCYTYGAPRVGNHAFAEDFDKIINDCFHVVNHQVHLPRCGANAGQLWYLFYGRFSRSCFCQCGRSHKFKMVSVTAPSDMLLATS